MKNFAVRLTDNQVGRITDGYNSLHQAGRSALDCWINVRKWGIKTLQRKGFTAKQREQLRELKLPRGSGRNSLLTQTADIPSLHSKLLTLTEPEAIVLAELIRTKKTRRLWR